jgi:hypothetical protein
VLGGGDTIGDTIYELQEIPWSILAWGSLCISLTWEEVQAPI